MTIDEKIKQEADNASLFCKCKGIVCHGCERTIQISFIQGADFAKSEMLADMQKLVEALEYCAENADPENLEALTQKFICMRGACRIALSEWKQKYQGEK